MRKLYLLAVIAVLAVPSSAAARGCSIRGTVTHRSMLWVKPCPARDLDIAVYLNGRPLQVVYMSRTGNTATFYGRGAVIRVRQIPRVALRVRAANVGATQHLTVRARYG